VGVRGGGHGGWGGVVFVGKKPGNQVVAIEVFIITCFLV
jgi:hypothetical protein